MPRLREVMSLSGHEGTFAGYIGKIVVSHKTNYLCVALENDALLLFAIARRWNTAAIHCSSPSRSLQR